MDTANAKAVAEALAGTGSAAGVGVDQELISAVPSHSPTFVSRNFTPSEIAYCNSQPAPASSFAARWAGKEAVFKSLGVPSKGAGAAMLDIEILPNKETSAPEVTLHGDAKKAAEGKGITNVLISLSHSEVCSILIRFVFPSWFLIYFLFSRLSRSPLHRPRLRHKSILSDSSGPHALMLFRT